ncbi:hypothetical protein [Kitasatospora sp. NBC_00315]|uniref:hypothetical protein n=1 Tax=Kitasatospora sp. NBC_00315 TaxID=2975963 RepID=UPI0032521FE6
MSEAKITDLTVEGTDDGVRVTVVVEGPRPDVADLQLLVDGKQVTLLLGPLALTPQPSPQVDVNPLIQLGTAGRTGTAHHRAGAQHRWKRPWRCQGRAGRTCRHASSPTSSHLISLSGSRTPHGPHGAPADERLVPWHVAHPGSLAATMSPPATLTTMCLLTSCLSHRPLPDPPLRRRTAHAVRMPSPALVASAAGQ